MTRYCEICNSELEDFEDTICQNCQVSMISNDNIYPNLGDIA